MTNAHTENTPLGEHNHPEIEKALNDRIDWVHERIDSLRDDIYSSDSDTKESGIMIGKSKDGDSIMAEDNKTKKKAGEEDAGNAGDNAGDNTPDATTEGKAMQTAIVEVKSMLEKEQESRELTYEQNLALQHVQTFVKITPTKAKKLYKELVDLEFMSEENAMKIVDIMPEEAEDVRAVFAKERFTLEEGDADKILSIVEQYL